MAIVVKRQADDSDDKMIARFRSEVIEANHIEQIKEAQFHKTNARKRNEQNEERKRLKKRARRRS